MTKPTIWSSMKNNSLFSGYWLLCHEGKTNKQKMSSLFSDMLSVINHRRLSEGNKTCVVMRLLFQWDLFCLNDFFSFFFLLPLCVYVWAGPEGIGYSPCCLQSAAKREYGAMRTGDKKRERNYSPTSFLGYVVVIHSHARQYAIASLCYI